jgi:hypothetical protein
MEGEGTTQSMEFLSRTDRCTKFGIDCVGPGDSDGICFKVKKSIDQLTILCSCRWFIVGEVFGSTYINMKVGDGIRLRRVVVTLVF